jgi:tetratricopeptide (TPR) repeat protein
MKLLAPCLALTALLLCSCISAEARLASGDSFYARGDYALAMAEYHAARAKDPTLDGVDERIRHAHLRLHLQRGDEAMAQRAWADAERCYREADRAEPGNQEIAGRLEELRGRRADEHFLRGQELLTRANPFDAVLEFEHALTFRNDHPRAREALARAMEEKREREAKAELAFEQGELAFRSGDPESAVRGFRKTLELNPHHPEAGRQLTEARERAAVALLVRGEALLSEREWDRALQAFEEARTYDSRLPGIDERVRRVERERKAAQMITEGDRAFERENWTLAHERYAQARGLSEDESFQARWDTARECLAADIFSRAEAAEASGDLHRAALLYRSIEGVDSHYRDAAARATRLGATLRTAEDGYALGCRAQERRDLFEAKTQFGVCVEAIPGFLDVAERLAAVGDGLDSAECFYDRAVQAETRGDYPRAEVLFDECLQIAKPFRDLPGRLVRLRELAAEREILEQTYTEACRAQDARDLERAQELFLECRRRDREFRDVGRRLPEVAAQLETADRLYQRAVRSERRCELQRALALYDESLRLSNPYRDAARRLQMIREAFVALREAREWRRERRLWDARQHCHRILESYEAHGETRELLEEIDGELGSVDKRYQALLVAERRRDFDVALQHVEAIREQCVGYKDVKRRATAIAAEMDYAEGCRLERDGDYGGAARRFQGCLARQPSFRDAGERLRACRAKR